MKSKMPKPTTHDYSKWLGLAGVIMMFIPERVSIVWGNMLAYVTSYFYFKHGNISVASNWALSSVLLGGTLGSIIVGNLPSCIGRKKLIFTAILFSNFSFLSMYFTLKYGYSIMVFIALGNIGFSNGFSNPLVIKIVSEFSGPSKGKYISIACSALNFGVTFINFFVGFYMNPENKSPNLMVDHMMLFNEKDLFDKVPSLIIILGISYLVCMCSGFCLLCYSTRSSLHSHKQKTAESPEKLGDYQPLITTPQQDHGKSSEIEMNNMEPKVFKLEGAQSEKTSCSDFVALSDTSEDEEFCSAENHDDITMEKEPTTLQNLKGITFYVISFTFSIGIFPIVLLFGSYKTYGLLFTKNDHLLTMLGTLHPFVGGVGRLFYGFILDKFRIKTCLISMYTFISFTTMLVYFAPAVNVYLYFFAVILATTGANIMYPTYLLATVSYFGENRFVTMWYMIKIPRILLGFIIAPLFEILQDQFGWLGPFACVSFVTVISVILIQCLVPDISKNDVSKDNDK